MYVMQCNNLVGARRESGGRKGGRVGWWAGGKHARFFDDSGVGV
jgi:hypothetical protein